MGIFKIDVTATNPTDRTRKTKPFLALVDTGSHMTWLPKKALAEAGIVPEGKKRFRNANNQPSERDFGYAILSAGGFSTIGDVVFAEANDAILLGVHTLEGFGVKVDNINGRFESVERLFTGITLIHEGEEE
jgi:predicted aspartyl protease